MPVVETGLLKYWNAKDGVKSGNVLANLAPSQAAHNMAIVGATYNAAGGYLQFDGVDDYVTVNNASVYQVGGSWTFEYIWNQLNNFGTGYHAIVEGGAYFDQDHSYPGFYIEVYLGNNHQPREYVTNTIAQTGQKHYVWRCTGTALELWINNVLIGTTTVPNGVHMVRSTNAVFHFNNGIATTEYQARFHAHRFYQRALTTAEMTQNYNNGLEIGFGPPVVPMVKAGTFKASTGDMIPVYDLAGHEATQPFRFWLGSKKVFIPLVPVTDPAASRVRFQTPAGLRAWKK